MELPYASSNLWFRTLYNIRYFWLTDTFWFTSIVFIVTGSSMLWSQIGIVYLDILHLILLFQLSYIILKYAFFPTRSPSVEFFPIMWVGGFNATTKRRQAFTNCNKHHVDITVNNFTVRINKTIWHLTCEKPGRLLILIKSFSVQSTFAYEDPEERFILLRLQLLLNSTPHLFTFISVL